MIRRLPWLTLGIIAVAVGISLFPNTARFLIYDRTAIEAGEIWRLFTGHWVHLSGSHLAWNVVVFVIVGCVVEDRRLRCSRCLWAVVPWGIGLAVFLLEPEMQFYAGLSGMVTAAVAYLALCGLDEKPPWRWVCVGLLAAMLCKVTLEWTGSNTLFATVDRPDTMPAATAHAAGAIMGLLLWPSQKLAFPGAPLPAARGCWDGCKPGPRASP